MQTTPFSSIEMADGSRRVLQKIEPQPQNSDLPSMVFLAGHGSDMLGSKAEFLAEYASQNGFGLLRFDYYGHGKSDGNLKDGNLSIWVNDALHMLDTQTTGPQILIGSSLGGWVMLRLAQERSNRLAGLIGIAAAPDFTENLIWQSLDEATKQQMVETGFIAMENPYSDEDVIYTYDLITDGRENLVLGNPIDIDVPVFLHHGLEDEEVPYQTAFDIARALHSQSCNIILDKLAGHRYSEPHQLSVLKSSLDQIYAAYQNA